MGHNETSAFTLTIFGSDQEDIYVYETNPDNPREYRFNDAWEAMVVSSETFEIRDHGSETHDILFTRHGPVLLSEPHRNRAFALRSVWWEPGTCAYLAGVSTMRAHDLESFQNGISRFGAPALNHVYADTSGTIAWLPYGFTPIRETWDGLMPVRGDGHFEWKGMVPLADMPNMINPERGFVASANEMNLPSDRPPDAPAIGYEWLEASRARRINAVLQDARNHDVADSCALQADTMSVPGLRLQALLREAALNDDSQVGAAAQLLLEWDGRLEVGSAAGLLQEWWLHKCLKPALFALFVDDAGLRPFLHPGDVEGILSALERPSTAFGDNPSSARNQLLRETLQQADADLTERFGSNRAQWRWGDLHHAYFEHPLSRCSPPAFKTKADVGPVPKPGSASTVMHAAYRDTDFRVTNGASVRLVMDVGDWDRSRCVNAPGQSGDARSPFYSNLFSYWAQGQYVPLLYSDASIEAEVERRILLSPKSINGKTASSFL
jgi:penicillin amidase